MTNAIERMQRVRMIEAEVPSSDVPLKNFIAAQSLRHGLSRRTINEYLQTLIDADRAVLNGDMIRRQDV